MDSDAFKRQAAAHALEEVRGGMRLGLGTGSTARHFVDLLGARVREGLDVLAVPTSEATRLQAERLGVRLATLDEAPRLDLTVDGADEIGPALTLVKGGGGSLLREKIVAAASERMLVIADASKEVSALGAFPLPIEVVRFGARATLQAIEQALARAGAPGTCRMRSGAGGHPFVTDGGNLIVDAALGRIDEPAKLACLLSAVPGVVEHGLFIGIAQAAIVAGPQGLRVLARS